MTWARTLALGSGALAFRLEIEGWPYQFVTDARLAGTLADGRIRVAGMQAHGITIGEDIDITKATLEARGCTITMADVAGNPTYAFSKAPDWRGVLLANATATATSFSVNTVGGLSGGEVLHVGTEAVLVGTASGATLSNLTRGYWGTFGQAHYTADGAHLGYPAITDRPYTARGRRARIFVYGTADAIGVGDNGTQIWLGRVASDAVISGASWSIHLDSIAAVLSQDLGQNLNEPIVPRGIYYPWSAPLIVRVANASGADNGGAFVAGPVDVPLYGFYETQEAFVAALNVDLASATSTWDTPILAESMGTGGWRLVAQTPGATPKYPYMAVYGDVDHQDSGAIGTAVDADGAAVNTVAISTSYYCPVFATVPRGAFAHNPGVTLTAADAAHAETWPDMRVYLGGAIGIDSLMTAAIVQWPGVDGPTAHSISGNAGSRYITLDTGVRAGIAYEIERINYGTDFGLPLIKLTRDYGRGTLYSLIYAIATNAAAYMNTGGVPDLRSTGTAATEDLDLSTSTTTSVQAVVNAATGTGTDPLTSRRQWFAYGPKKLSEVFAAEAQLLGCVWCIDTSGRLALRQIPTPTAGTYAPATIGASTLDMARGFGTWQRAAFGTLNTVRFKHAYDPVEDKYRGPTIDVRDPTAFAIDKTTRLIMVEPVSTSIVDRDGRLGDAVAAYDRIAGTLLGIFGGPYATINVPVNLAAFSVLCGDVVELTHAQLPDPDTGTLGITSRACIVIGREWEMSSGHGSLTLVTSLARVAGYTPSMRVTGSSGSGTSWTVTLNAADIDTGYYVDPTSDVTDWFEVGDAVRLWEWDDASPEVHWGTVAARSTTTLGVTLLDAWTGHTAGTGVWIVDYARGKTVGDGATIPTLSTNQKRYAFMADDVHRIWFVATHAFAFNYSA